MTSMDAPSCLLAVDIQQGFINAATAKIPLAVRKFCDRVHIQHRIFTRFINPGESGQFVKILGWDRLQGEPEISLAPEVDELPTLVVDKRSYSPFMDGKLIDALRNFEATDVLVFGIETDACVFQSALDLFDRGLRPLVIADLSMSTAGRQYHHAALRMLARHIGSESIVNASDLG